MRRDLILLIVGLVALEVGMVVERAGNARRILRKALSDVPRARAGWRSALNRAVGRLVLILIVFSAALYAIKIS